MGLTVKGQIELTRKMLSLYKQSPDYANEKLGAKYFVCFCFVFVTIYIIKEQNDENFELDILSNISDAGNPQAFGMFRCEVDMDDFRTQWSKHNKYPEASSWIHEKIEALLEAK